MCNKSNHHIIYSHIWTVDQIRGATRSVVAKATKNSFEDWMQVMQRFLNLAVYYHSLAYQLDEFFKAFFLVIQGQCL